MISKRIISQLNPDKKTSFRVKGTLDTYAINKTSVLPIGDGRFILPVNAAIRKGTGKTLGDRLMLSIEMDEAKLPLSRDLLQCLKEEPEALKFFKALSKGYQYYISKWVESAKTPHTKTKRIAVCLTAFSKKMNYTEMMQEYKNFER